MSPDRWYLWGGRMKANAKLHRASCVERKMLGGLLLRVPVMLSQKIAALRGTYNG